MVNTSKVTVILTDFLLKERPRQEKVRFKNILIFKEGKPSKTAGKISPLTGVNSKLKHHRRQDHKWSRQSLELTA